MRGSMWWLYQPWKWLVVLPFFAVDTVVMFTVCLMIIVVAGPLVASRIAGTIWGRLMVWVAFVRLKQSGREWIDPKQSYVIIANHQSAYDIFVVYGWLGIDFKWVMKKEIRKVPFLGYACWKMDHIFVDRKNNAAAVASLQEARKHLTGGTSVFFFPEGTRTQTSELKPFKKGAFKMAVDLGLPILPVTLKGMDHILPTKTLNLYPGEAELIFHEPIPTTGLTDADIDGLIERSRAVISKPLYEGAAEALPMEQA